jgi:hypothetical protein
MMSEPLKLSVIQQRQALEYLKKYISGDPNYDDQETLIRIAALLQQSLEERERGN